MGGGRPVTSVFWPIKPCPKPRQTRSDKWKKRPAVLRYRAFRDKVKALGVKLPQPCTVIFWLPMPKSWPASKRTRMQGQPHQVKPDLDNLIKALWDAITRRDERLWCVHAEKRWGAHPGIEVSMGEADYQAQRAAA